MGGRKRLKLLPRYPVAVRLRVLTACFIYLTKQDRVVEKKQAGNDQGQDGEQNDYQAYGKVLPATIDAIEICHDTVIGLHYLGVLNCVRIAQGHKA
jgi:hypothetical protein